MSLRDLVILSACLKVFLGSKIVCKNEECNTDL